MIASTNQSHRSQSYQPLEEFTVSVDHKHFLASRLLLHSVFGNHQLVRDDHGKPHLTSTDQVHIHSANTHINYSHANDWVVLACHNQFSVGIDIESARPQLHRIYKRFCSSKEMEWMGADPSTLLLQKSWCAKEALYKALGKKGTDFRNHLYLHPFAEHANSMNADILANDSKTSAIPGNPPNASMPLTTEVHFLSMSDMVVAATILPQ